MKSMIKRMALVAALLMLAVQPALALDMTTRVHDPSTVVLCDGKYYAYGTGGGMYVSDDGWTWRTGPGFFAGGGGPSREVLQYVPGYSSPWAPDVVKVGDRYFLYYAASGQAHKAAVGLLTNKTLDPNSPDYKWEDGGPIAWSLGDGNEDLHAIDPGVFHDPNDGSLWLTYGSYFGTIRLCQLDPKTGKRLNAEQSKLSVANNSEASDMMYHDGWYYLLTNHGTCCAGASSTYNIRMGRSKKVTGPYLDDHDVDMARGGGKLFAASGDRKIGPGHFGLLDLGDGVQKWSCHFEADLDRGGISVMDIRPLLWRDGWPVAGENLREGSYQVMSKHAGTVLELAVTGATVGGRGGRGAGGRVGGAGRGTGAGAPGGAGAGGGGAVAGPVPDQAVTQVSQNWPAGNVDVRMAPYLLQAQQKWTLTPVPGSGAPGSPCFKITVAGTDRVLAATEDDELASVPSFTGAPEQVWQLDQLADGAYRIMPRTAHAVKEKLALTSIGRSTVTLAPFTADNDNQQWFLKQP